MKIDRELLRDKAYIVKFSALRIVANAEKIEALSRSRAKSETIEDQVAEAANYMAEFWRALKEAIADLKSPPGFYDDEDIHNAHIRRRAAEWRELCKQEEDELRAKAEAGKKG